MRSEIMEDLTNLREGWTAAGCSSECKWTGQPGSDLQRQHAMPCLGRVR